MAEEYAEWAETLATVTEGEGTVVLLGGTDVGKTTCTRLLVNRIVGQGKVCALLDADPGQSEVGPPGCIGWALVEAPVQSLSDLTARGLAFVGNASPQGHLPEHIAGARRLADLASPHRLIVDTCGYLHGSGARRLNLLEADLLQPAHVIGLQRNGELEAILAPLRRRDNCTVYTPPVPAVITRKPPSFRAQRRAMRFAAYFQNAAVHTYSFDEVAFAGTWLNSATPVAAHILKFLNQTLGRNVKVYHAEMSDRDLLLMTNQPLPPQSPSVTLCIQTLKARSLAVAVAPRMKNVLLGLEGANGKMLGLGLLVALDFRRRTLGVLTPVRAPAAACLLRFGTLRLYADGTEIGSLKPGEI